jgi:two-component system, cell cycle sensor histidine kinase and response regulator CckA
VQGPKETILVVDDEPSMRNVMIRMITVAGYFVLEAANSAEAMQLVRSFSEPIHLAIIDQTLDDGKGIDVANEIIAMRPDVRVLLVSGYFLTGENIGGVPCLQKPFARQVLYEKIRQLLAPANSLHAGS